MSVGNAFHISVEWGKLKSSLIHYSAWLERNIIVCLDSFYFWGAGPGPIFPWSGPNLIPLLAALLHTTDDWDNQFFFVILGSAGVERLPGTGPISRWTPPLVAFLASRWWHNQRNIIVLDPVGPAGRHRRQALSLRGEGTIGFFLW